MDVSEISSLCCDMFAFLIQGKIAFKAYNSRAEISVRYLCCQYLPTLKRPVLTFPTQHI